MSRYTSKLQNIQEANIKNENRFLHGKRLLVEGVNLKAFKALFGDAAESLVQKLSTNFTDDAVKSFEVTLGKALSNPNNLKQIGGQPYFKSLRGSEIPFKQIENALKSVADGTYTAEQIADSLPRQLADGTELRKAFVDNFKKIDQKAAEITGKQSSKLSTIGQSYKNLAEEISGWVQMLDVKGNMSGWKFHIFCDNFDDSVFLADKLHDVLKKWGAGFKLGSKSQYINSSIGKQGSIQYGKGATIYIPADVIAKKQQRQFLAEIESAISGYKSSGTISGDRMINKNIGYRFELSQPIDAAQGVTNGQYRALYSANAEGSKHNIPGNMDIF